MQGDSLKSTIDGIARRVESFGRMNDKVAMQSHILAVNSMIEAAPAGQHGRGFSVVAAEMKRLSDQTKDHADQFRQDVMAIVQTATTETGDLMTALEAAATEELIEKAKTLVQLIVRNLFERTADVRWWSTDPALWEALTDPTDQRYAFAHERLTTIHRYYTVYSDLVLTDLSGQIIASAAGGRPPRGRFLPADGQAWFGRAARLASGHDYAVSDVHESSLHGGRKTLVYATPVRTEGRADGKAVGVLAVYFDWQKEAQIIVKEEAGFSERQWATRRVLLLDGAKRIIASSDGADFMATYPHADRLDRRGILHLRDGTRIGYARTIGYQDYDGLGWYGVVEDRQPL